MDSGINDAELVREILAGQRSAFEQLVRRYQTLICSIAFSATGDLGRSEDLAQETFLTAWKKMGSLREPARVKSWLVGIVRNLAQNTRRKESREPVAHAEESTLLELRPGPEPLPGEEAASQEEQAILWRALGDVPELYREPLILFYREQQSILQVAAELDLTEDTVKQRLARGRKLLRDEVHRFVEGALSRSTPGRAFTLGVLAALPMVQVSAATVTAGAAATKGTSIAGLVSFVSWFAAILGPIIGLLGGWLGLKASLANAGSERERRFIRTSAVWMTVGISAFLALQGAFVYGARNLWATHGRTLALALAGLSIVYVILILVAAFYCNHVLRKIQAEEGRGLSKPLHFQIREYTSRVSFLGLPLIHFCSGRHPDGRMCVARGWIAVGDVAFGAIACGGMAIGLLASGGCCVGLLSLGGAAFGALAIGGLGVGWYAFGGAAIGIQAAGGCAIALQTAFGGAAVAMNYAVGGSAHALHANDAAARAVITNHPFFVWAQWFTKHGSMFVWLPLIAVILQARWYAKGKGRFSQTPGAKV